MGANDHLIEAAANLVEAAHKGIDEAMPEKLASIVKTHAALGVGAAWVPVPGVGLAAGISAIWSMYYRINGALEIPFGDNVTKSVASAVGTNLAGYLGALMVAEGLKLVPGIGSFAGAVVASAAQYALLLASGYVYMRILTSLLGKKNVENITESDLKRTADEVMSDKEAVRSFIEDAKRSYKKK